MLVTRSLLTFLLLGVQLSKSNKKKDLPEREPSEIPGGRISIEHPVPP